MATTVRALSLSIAVSTSTGPGVMRCVASLRLTATGVASSRRSLVLLALLRLRPDRDVEYYAGAQSAGHADPRRGWPGVARPAPCRVRQHRLAKPLSALIGKVALSTICGTEPGASIPHSQNRLHFHPIFIFACYAFPASFTRGLPILRSNHEMRVTDVCCGSPVMPASSRRRPACLD